MLAKDLLFATLDPTMRALKLPGGRKAILSDTVGFIADLPVELVAAFRATLEEVLEADIIAHVRDAAHDETDAQKADVLKVLAELGIDPEGERPIVEILNKIDLLEPSVRKSLLARNSAHRPGGDLRADGRGRGAIFSPASRMCSARARRSWIYASILRTAPGLPGPTRMGAC